MKPKKRDESQLSLNMNHFSRVNHLLPFGPNVIQSFIPKVTPETHLHLQAKSICQITSPTSHHKAFNIHLTLHHRGTQISSPEYSSYPQRIISITNHSPKRRTNNLQTCFQPILHLSKKQTNKSKKVATHPDATHEASHNEIASEPFSPAVSSHPAEMAVGEVAVALSSVAAASAAFVVRVVVVVVLRERWLGVPPGVSF